MTDADNKIALTPEDERTTEGTSTEIPSVALGGQTVLFTGPPVPMDELMKRQGIDGPQGLAAFVDPEWELDEESERFLDVIFAETD